MVIKANSNGTETNEILLKPKNGEVAIDISDKDGATGNIGNDNN